MNKDLYNNEFSENAKTAVVWPSNKKSDRPESVLHGFAKIFAKQYVRFFLTKYFQILLQLIGSSIAHKT